MRLGVPEVLIDHGIVHRSIFNTRHISHFVIVLLFTLSNELCRETSQVLPSRSSGPLRQGRS